MGQGERTLGDGLVVSAIGLGCMSFTGAYATSRPDPADAIPEAPRA